MKDFLILKFLLMYLFENLGFRIFQAFVRAIKFVFVL